MGVVLILVGLVMIFLIMLLPTWLLLLAYNYIVTLMGHVDWEIPVTFWSVVCVAFIISVLRSIFSGGK